MPIYEYECQTCGVHFERKQSVNDDPVRICPECGGKVRKLFFAAGIIFKGSGFYVTDSQNNRNRLSEEGKAGKVEGGKKEEGKTGRVEGGRKEESKAEKVEGGKKEESKANEVEGGKKEESK